MTKVLITGATGNVGLELFDRASLAPGLHLVAGVRDPGRAAAKNPVLAGFEARKFDFEDPSTFAGALEGIDAVFLLRPPHLSQVGPVFGPLVDELARRGTRTVLLSVQGAEASKVIPHRQIELLLEARGVPSVFLRPSYFMQNLTTTLAAEIQGRGTISLPSGRGVFNWVDVGDLAEAALAVLGNLDGHLNQALVLTGTENLNFHAVADRIRAVTGQPVKFRSVGPWGYFLRQRSLGTPGAMVLVTFLLHFLPRVQGAPTVDPTLGRLLGRTSTVLDAFLAAHAGEFGRRP